MEYIKDFRKTFEDALKLALQKVAKSHNIDATLLQNIQIPLEVPKDSALGDIAAPMFLLSKVFRLPPATIAAEVAPLLTLNNIGTIKVSGPYINLTYNSESFIYSTLRDIHNNNFDYSDVSDDGVTVVEFSSPNTNKPLHLGHLRNDALGQSTVNILRETGRDTKAVDLINDRGVHICQSMLAYKLFHEAAGDTPESTRLKSDHFVGNCYVEFSQYVKDNPERKADAEAMLIAWERGDDAVRALWQKMNDWAISGIQATYKRTLIHFDKLYRESNTYLLGKDIIEKGLSSAVFFKAPDGSVRCDVTEVTGAAKDGAAREKVLIRADGTSVYITQDIGTACARYNDYKFSRMIYVVASEQNDHFKMLFYILKKLGFQWAKNLFHLSYGLVNLPNGRMKSREGTVVDADDLLDALHDDALKIVMEKGYVSKEDASDAAEKIALGAVNYFLLAQSPAKDMIFNPDESLSFTGNTGPYIQYMGSRLTSIIKKAREESITANYEDALSLLKESDEIALAKVLSEYCNTVKRAAKALDPSIMVLYAYNLCRAFSAFYNSCPVTTAKNSELSSARLALVESTLTILKKVMALILVPYLEKM